MKRNIIHVCKFWLFYGLNKPNVSSLLAVLTTLWESLRTTDNLFVAMDATLGNVAGAVSTKLQKR